MNALLTDMYQLTMGYGYWKTGLYHRESVFHLYFRKIPFGNRYAIAAGLELALNYLKNFKFETEEIHYLASLKGVDGTQLFDESYLNYLQRLKLEITVDAIPEGTAVFPNEPLLRVRGPLLQCQLIETALLTLINFSTLIATKASRIRKAAKGDTIMEFGLRRAQGFDGGVSASRAAYIGGCHGTSNVEAGFRFGIPVRGTHAHSWVMAHDDEQMAFDEYANSLPNNCILLVDTYNTLEGVKKAVNTGLKLREKGHDLIGIRLDSGDLTSLSIAARKLLDDAGFQTAKIVASNDLDEYEIEKLKSQGAMIDTWGVGTRLVTSYDQPALGGVYKLAAIKNDSGTWDYKQKFSEDKIKRTIPGILSACRIFENGKPLKDIIFDIDKTTPTGEILLKTVIENGNFIHSPESIQEIRQRSIAQQDLFNAENGVYEVVV